MRDTALAIAARATSPQLKAPFHALSLNSHPVNTAAFAAAINTIMTDIYHSNWIADVHQLVIDPNVQGERETVVLR
jgi:hypothetical protein